MDKKYILILDSVGNDWTDLNMINPDVEVGPIYKQINILGRALRKAYFRLNLPFKYLWYAKWKENINAYTHIIIFDALLENDIFKYIEKKFPNTEVYFYYRNPMSEVKTCFQPQTLLKSQKNVSLWTFDPRDAENCNLKYNPQFYFDIPAKTNSNIEYDVVFIGSSKNRIQEILDIREMLVCKNIKVCFHIVRSKGRKYLPEQEKYITDRFIAYEEIRSLARQSRCILDINQAGQSGMTLRVVEALFLKKKLITNNQTIKNVDFYNPRNIFIIGIDSWEGIEEFVRSDYELVPKYILQKYEYKYWLNRFLDNQDFCNE